MFSIIHDSDLHFGRNGNLKARDDKESNRQVIIDNDSDSDFVIVTGDLTENGYDGKQLLCYNYGGFSKQLQMLKEDYVNPLESEGISVKLCIGNHDRGRPPYLYQPVFNYVKERHGEIEYSFDHKGFRFICCGKYPKRLEWLEEQLQENVPTIIFFHYNLEGEWSDFWKEDEKAFFSDVINGYNIVAILVGHHHISDITNWKDYTVISSAGKGYTQIILDPSDGTIYKVIFKN